MLRFCFQTQHEIKFYLSGGRNEKQSKKYPTFFLKWILTWGQVASKYFNTIFHSCSILFC